jgi:ketosteroid isomerase-like protein
MSNSIEQEGLAAYKKLVAVRDEIDEGKKPWSAMADLFTEDAAYIDPAWGRYDGREEIRAFFERSMAGLTGYGWETPEHWTMADGHRVVSQWDQVMGRKEDGTPWAVAGLSILYYARDGLFCYSHDMLNMQHVNQMLREMQWKPPAEFSMPPKRPNRDISLPPAWAHFEASRAPK